MDLWHAADRWARPEDEHHHAPPTLTAAIVMWITVLMPYLGLSVLIFWTIAMAHDWISITAFVLTYLAIGFGVTIGYHRLLAHRAFNTYRWVEGIFIVLGCMSMQGPPIRWAATHRRHHQKSDHDGDPHSPNLHGDGALGVLRGLWHAHTGWLLTPDKPHIDRSVKDLLRDPMIRMIDRLYWLWLAISIAVPFTIGFLGYHYSWTGGLACVFWAVVVRISLMHHATWSVNSVCHTFGYRNYEATDESRNNPIVAIVSLGEGWHNNHHAFPTSARHGMRWFEFDLSWMVIRTLELSRLVWDVRRPSSAAMKLKQVGQAVADTLSPPAEATPPGV